jgi:hypothetical protein
MSMFDYFHAASPTSGAAFFLSGKRPTTSGSRWSGIAPVEATLRVAEQKSKAVGDGAMISFS